MNFGGKKKKAAFPWRQNFRDEKLLPDLKIVRTHFIYNSVTVALLCIFLGLFVYQEYSLSVRSAILRDLKTQIGNESKADKRNQADSVRFTKDMNKALEASRFADVPIKPERFFAELARVQSPNGRYVSMAFSRVAAGTDPSLASYQLAIDGTMAPSADGSAPAEVGKFVDKLRGMPVWKNCEHDVELISSAPSADLDYFEYSLKLTWKPGKEAVKAK
jgi:hypothetical protein